MSLKRGVGESRKCLAHLLVICMIITSCLGAAGFAAPVVSHGATAGCDCADGSLGANEEKFTVGNGADEPYEIGTAAQLNHLRKHLAANARLTANIDLKDFQSGMGWVPIGVVDTGDYTGNFDGQGFMVKNLTINDTTGAYAEKGVGLFGGAKGTIKNVIITDFSLSGTTATKWYPIGGLVGAMRWGTIDQVAVLNGTVDFTGTAAAGYSFAGGTIGHVGGKAGTVSVSNVYEAGVTVASSGTGHMYAGGTVGTGRTNDSTPATVTVENIVVKDVAATVSGAAQDPISGLFPVDASKALYDITGKTEHAELLTNGLGDLPGDVWSVANTINPIPAVFERNAAALAALQVYAGIAESGGCGCTDLGENEACFTAGDGGNRPYEIATAAQLNHLRKHLAANAKLTANIDLKDFQSGMGWVPIGVVDTGDYTGNFDGQGFMVKNLTINDTTGAYAEKGVGLFGGAKGTIKNVIITDFSLSGTTATKWYPIGGLVGAMRWGTIDQVAVLNGTVDFTGTAAAGYSFAGGTIGHVGGKAGTVSVSNVYEAGVTVASSGTGHMYAGGTVGTGRTNDSTPATVTVENIVVKDVAATVSGAAQDPISGLFPVDASKALYDITGKTEHAELLAAGLDRLSVDKWSKEEGFYPYLSAFSENAAAMALLRVKVPGSSVESTDTAVISGSVLDLMKNTAAYGGDACTLVMTQRTVPSGQKLAYKVDDTHSYELYYSPLKDAYIGYVPAANVTEQDIKANVVTLPGDSSTIKYGLIGGDWKTRTKTGYADLYFFDKAVYVLGTAPEDGIEHVLAMDTNVDFELDIDDLYSIIRNYISATPFAAR